MRKMIEIDAGFTSICAGADPIPHVSGTRAPTGARITLEFRRDRALPAGETVRAHYEFAADGRVRTATGIPIATRSDTRGGRKIAFYYRLSHWIEPSALMASVR